MPFSDNSSVFEAELWDPATETFTLLAAAQTPRNYHSVAVRGHCLLRSCRFPGLCCTMNHEQGLQKRSADGMYNTQLKASLSMNQYDRFMLSPSRAPSSPGTHDQIPADRLVSPPKHAQRYAVRPPQILLPDARVFNGGGGLCGDGCLTEGANHFNGEIFSPPYLFSADGTLAPRPSITGAPSVAVGGAVMVVTTDTAVEAFSLIRVGCERGLMHLVAFLIGTKPGRGSDSVCWVRDRDIRDSLHARC